MPPSDLPHRDALDEFASPELRRAVLILARAAKSVRLYPAGSDVRTRFVRDLMAAFEELFEQIGPIRLTFGKGQVLVDQEVVLQHDGRDEPVPGRLYWDGVRELCFVPGLDEAELTEFLELIGSPSTGSEQDDLATLLWARRFPHIEHVALDALVGTDLTFDPLSIPEELGSPSFDQVDVQMHESVDPQAAAAAGRAFLDDLRTTVEDSNLEVFQVSSDERAFLLAELHGAEGPAQARLELIELVRAIVAAETDATGLSELARILGNGLRRFIVEGDLAAAREVAALLRENAESRPDLDAPTRAALAAPLRLPLEDRDIDTLVELLEQPSSAALAYVAELIASLTAESTPTWCEVLGRLQTPTARRRLLEALAPYASSRPELFEPFLRDRRWYLVRNVALLLGRSGEPRAFEALQMVLRHPESRVRKEALRAISGVDGAGAEGIVFSTLRDPDTSLRRWAAHTCVAFGGRATPHLEAAIRAHEFATREMGERAAFLEAYGRAARDAAVPLLESLLEPRGLFRAKPPEPLRAALFDALAAAGGARAESTLLAQSHDRSPTIRSAARSALARLARETPEAAA